MGCERGERGGRSDSHLLRLSAALAKSRAETLGNVLRDEDVMEHAEVDGARGFARDGEEAHLRIGRSMNGTTILLCNYKMLLYYYNAMVKKRP